MSAELAQLPPLPRPLPFQSRADLYATAAVLAILLAAQHSTYGDMLAVWQRSQTFAHGFIVLPVSLWLLWRQRARLTIQPRQPYAPALAVLAGLGLLWLLATVANVYALQQYCAILMVPATIAAMLGWRVVRTAVFPLAYLLLAVPFGEVFIPPLIDFTARFTVAALQLSGIPVYRDNNHFTLPSGSWDVVEACSGLRYVIASSALGTLFAYLTYRSMRRRLLFVGISLLLPVLANGVRAYLIVLIGHLSDMRMAAGIDHLVYGWLFFGLVSLLLFWCGAAWREQEGAVTAPPSSRIAAHRNPPPASGRLAMTGIACAVLLTAWPLTARWLLEEAPPTSSEQVLMLADPPPPWRRAEPSPYDWQALHTGHPQRYAATFHDGQHRVTLQLTWYPHQTRGAELLTPVQQETPSKLPAWHEVADSIRFISVGRRLLPVRVTLMQAGTEKMLVWRSYRVGPHETASLQRVKWQLAAAKLLRQPDGGAELALSSRFDEMPDGAALAMQQLLAAMLPAIDQGLDHVAPR
jgi:exosortase A